MKRLCVSFGDGPPCLVLTWTPEQGLESEYAQGELTTAVERWKAQGLCEWIRENPEDPSSVEPRRTRCTEEAFLSRLAVYLGQHYNAKCALVENLR
jgi:hypothetical protein